MSTAVARARRMLEGTGRHPVVSLYLDLDPSRFATAPARATQVRSLIDEAERDGRLDRDELSHTDRTTLTADLERLEAYLGSDEPPVSGARALAVFCSGQDDLFEVLPLPVATPATVVIATTPHIEPLVAGIDEGRVAVALISHRSGRILVGDLAELTEAEDISDDVHGRTSRGGLSQSNYERSIEADVEHHMRRVAEELHGSWQQERFAHLALGGTAQDVDLFTSQLHNDLRPLLLDGRLDLEVEVASVADVRAALEPLLDRAREAATAAALAEFENRIGAGSRAARGLEDTLAALGERRVETVLLAHNFAAQGVRCPQCGLLYPEGTANCPADGTATVAVADLREAVVQAAVLQDASVLVFGEGSDPAPAAVSRGGGIAALLRF
ncbi:MAG TPA: Vms1/Ankzf1 family peptidyl-tRNA hydrolase [Solirubrobacteraceae bacterium]|nr:Vms1/Ankzf1 family peptidyl-tRNA hydrolase [Solirubrobacteraceae bacterium]